LRADKEIPEDSSSSYADEGTIAHDFAAQALRAYLAKTPFDYASIPDQIMAGHVKSFVELVLSKVTGDGQLFVEHSMPLYYAERGPADMQVDIRTVKTPLSEEFWVTPANLDDISEWGPYSTWDEARKAIDTDAAPLGYWYQEKGTADAVVLTEECLFVFDLKYGVGVSVEGQANDQTGIYAESFICEQGLRNRLPAQFDVQPTIFQPRDANHDLSPERVWFTSLGELEQISNTVLETADGIRRGAACKFTPGKKQCRFCPAKPKCKHKAAFDLDPAYDACIETPKSEESVVAGPWMKPADVEDIFSAEYLETIAARHMDGSFTDWLDSVVAYVMARRLEGHTPTNLVKLVVGKKNRVWADEGEAARLLRLKLEKGQVFTEKVISPSKAWELLPKELSTKFKNKLSSLIVKPDGDLTLVLASDKREAVEVKPRSASEEFGDVGQPEDEDLS
jgi:hypothetical protein